RVRSLSGLLLRGCNERALEVHPHVKTHDKEFREQSEAVGDVFAGMSREEKKKTQERFILARGGTLERREVEKRSARGAETSSTYEKTRLLLRAGKSIEEIARARGMAVETIENHIEHLARDGGLATSDIRHLEPKTEREKKRHTAIISAIAKVGDEKLKPIYEHLKGVYSYDDIRRVRALHLVGNN
ncbi:MAG: helix-turn-helix domain-containing protein, partial [Patescibacteria group bacterium]|nr:helix-turn-helix domain-containing protein [Patescibacteria group bacterium]